MATAALLIVGSEMLDPSRPDANGPHARARLAEFGIPLVSIARVADDLPALGAALHAALAAADVVLLSGGLGPTGDDLTREAVAAALGREVLVDPGWRDELAARLSRRGRTLGGPSLRQAHVVSGGRAIANPRGLACGCLLEHGARVIALLPGVPVEFAAMLDEGVLPLVAQRFPERPTVRTVRAIAAGLPEADAEPVLAPWYGRTGCGVSILPQSGVLAITFTITAPPADDPATLEAEARGALAAGLGKYLVSLDGTSLPEALGQRLLARGMTLAAAESCTGGRAAHRVVTVPGASRYFLGGVTAYANDAKTELLDVPPDVIAAHGAVSDEVARAMAAGARRRFGADCAIATTGVSGPDGGTPQKPVGLVYIAAATPDQVTVRRLEYPLDRVTHIEIASNYALYLLWSLLG